MNNRYRYVARYRPVDHGTVPAGFTELNGGFDSGFRFGWVEYDRPLGPDLVAQYELIPLDRLDPVILRHTAKCWTEHVRTEFVRQQDSYTVRDGVKSLHLTYDPYGQAQFRVTQLEGVVPVGHVEFNDFGEACRFLWDGLSIDRREIFRQYHHPAEPLRSYRPR